jgi:hypothetical protein
MIQLLEDALMLADDLEDGNTGFLIERALDEARFSAVHAKRVTCRIRQATINLCKRWADETAEPDAAHLLQSPRHLAGLCLIELARFACAVDGRPTSRCPLDHLHLRRHGAGDDSYGRDAH